MKISSFEEGMNAYNDQDYKIAFDIFQVLAEDHNADALYQLALMYEFGSGVTMDLDKSELGTTSTTFGGISLAYEELGASNSTTIGGSLAGVKLTRALGAGATFEATYTETKASGSMGGVSVSAHASS